MTDRFTWFDALIVALCILALFLSLFFFPRGEIAESLPSDGDFIKWVEFHVPAAAMTKAYKLSVSSAEDVSSQIDWVDLLAYCAAKDGGTFKNGWVSRMESVASELRAGKSIDSLTAEMEYFGYYQKAYAAVLGGFVGDFWEDAGNDALEKKYGLYAYSPIAAGYGFSHYEDFGNSRSFGYRRRHLGNDLLASVGTPVVAIEGGYVEEIGWNRYGGWRIGIRSFDRKRYWYYAHMRKNHPYHLSLSQGDIVYPGQVIGYVGMTGYSDQENVNGMQKPHLHLGLQLIFDESQKEGNGEIWVDVYSIVEFLQRNQMKTRKDEETKDYNALVKIYPVTWNAEPEP